MSDDDLLADIADAELANTRIRPCLACSALSSMSEEVRSGVSRAMSGTIGTEKLDKILARNGYQVGRRAIARHREEDHSG